MRCSPPIGRRDFRSSMRQLVRLVGGLILARLEGDSPVDYLEDLDTAAAKRVASAMIENPSADPDFLVRSIRGSHS